MAQPQNIRNHVILYSIVLNQNGCINHISKGINKVNIGLIIYKILLDL